MRTNLKPLFYKLFENGVTVKEIGPRIGIVNRDTVRRYYREWRRTHTPKEQLSSLTPAISGSRLFQCPSCGNLITLVKIEKVPGWVNERMSDRIEAERKNIHCPNCDEEFRLFWQIGEEPKSENGLGVAQ